MSFQEFQFSIIVMLGLQSIMILLICVILGMVIGKGKTK